MKRLIFMVTVMSFLGIAYAEESVPEKVQATANKITRNVKKGVHRTQEALCGKLTGDNKVQCLAKEAKHRMEEGLDVVKDKASEVKNKVDSDKK